VLTGTVTDTSGTPLADVRVHVLEVGRGTTTDAKGTFSLPELPSGTYGVAFSRIGYAPIVRRVTVGAEDVTLTVSMRPSAVELPEVQVTASPSVHDANATSAPDSKPSSGRFCPVSGSSDTENRCAKLSQIRRGIASVA